MFYFDPNIFWILATCSLKHPHCFKLKLPAVRCSLLAEPWLPLTFGSKFFNNCR